MARALVIAALATGVALRALLALVNFEANDSHLAVINIIAVDYRFPAITEDWEAFQPKLYHATAAALWRLFPTRSVPTLVRAAQLLSCAAGVLTLLVVLRFLREYAAGPPVARALTFAVVALNPALVGISAQATNDAFVILFATAGLYHGVRFFAHWRSRDFVALVVAAILAGLSKGNGLTMSVAVLAAFGAAALLRKAPDPRPRVRAAALGVAFFVLVVPAVALLGPYASYQREYGSPFVTSWNPSPRPHFFRETFVERPGLTSVQHGLLRFRIVDLLRHPESNYDRVNYPRHRTSLWTRLYAHANSSHFEAWPPSWKARNPFVSGLTRVLLLLGLVPAALLLWGLATMVRDAARQARGGAATAATAAAAPPPSVRPWGATVLLLLAALGYLGFVAVYSLRLRDYSSMKLIFVLPGLLGFVAAFEAGVTRLLAWGGVTQGGGQAPKRRPRLVLRGGVVRAAAAGLALLLLGYVIDACLLAAQLAGDRARGVPPPSFEPAPLSEPPAATLGGGGRGGRAAAA